MTSATNMSTPSVTLPVTQEPTAQPSQTAGTMQSTNAPVFVLQPRAATNSSLEESMSLSAGIDRSALVRRQAEAAQAQNAASANGAEAVKKVDLTIEQLVQITQLQSGVLNALFQNPMALMMLLSSGKTQASVEKMQLQIGLKLSELPQEGQALWNFFGSSLKTKLQAAGFGAMLPQEPNALDLLCKLPFLKSIREFTDKINQISPEYLKNLELYLPRQEIFN